MNQAVVEQVTQPHPAGAPWSIKELAPFLRISERHLKALMAGNKVPFIKLGNRTLITDKVAQKLATEGV